jgi:hypothetical protein
MLAPTQHAVLWALFMLVGATWHMASVLVALVSRRLLGWP